MTIPLRCEQLQFVAGIADLRNAFLDPIFLFLNYADSIYFLFLLIPLVWVGFSWRWGLRLFYLLMVSTLLNLWLKDVVGWPRPGADVPGISLLFPRGPRGFGFPSGGAQTCMLLGGLLIHSWKTGAAWIVGGLYIALVSFSRLYLGVHYPIDVLGGWAVGLFLLFLYVQCIGPIERFLGSQSRGACLALSVVFPLLLMGVTTSAQYHRFDAMAVGVGAFFSLKYLLYLPAPKSVLVGLVRGVIAVGGLFLLLAALPVGLPISLKYGVLALWISLGASPVCKKVFRRCGPSSRSRSP